MTKSIEYYYWIKPIAGRPNICSGFAKLRIQSESRAIDREYARIGYVSLTEEQARGWQYAPASGEMRSVVQEENNNEEANA